MSPSRSLTALLLAGSLGAGCVDDPLNPNGAPVGPDAGAPAAALLPEGTTGTVRVRSHDQIIELPYVVRNGQKELEDDWAIGPATAEPDGERSAAGTSLTPWLSNTINYCVQPLGAFSPLGLTTTEEGYVDAALAELQRITPLKFSKFTCPVFGDPPVLLPYIDYTRWANSFSQTDHGDNGHLGNTIHLALNWGSSTTPGSTVMHETGHAMGLLHEARRSDRDKWVNVYTNCVQPDGTNTHLSAFQLVSAANNRLLTPYDASSIMEYGSFGFSKDSSLCPTLLYDPDPDGNPSNDNDGHVACWPNPAGGCAYSSGGGPYWGTRLRTASTYSPEDINGVYQAYEPTLGVAETNDRFGARVAVGDFDGDGYDDLAVTAFGEAPGSHPSSGAVMLYKGTMNGLTAWRTLTEGDFAITQQTADGFGAGLVAADLNGDGKADLIVGAQQAGSARGGAVFTYLGSDAGPTPQPAFLTQSNSGAGTSEAGDLFGATVAVGTFAGGTTRYLAVGAPYENGTGMVQLFRWSAGTFTYASSISAPTPHSGDQFGTALVVDHLGGGDALLVGAPQIGTGAGMVIPYFAHSPMVAGTPLAHTSSATGDRFGTALGIGKITFGGPDVVVVGAPGRLSGTGRAYVYNVSLTTLGATYGQADELKQADIAGENGFTGDAFGSSIALGDLDGDGLSDIIIGAPGKVVSGLAGVGLIDIFYSFRPDEAMRPTQPTGNDEFGGAVAIGNFNAGAHSAVSDGRQDLIIAMPGRAVNGRPSAGAVNSYRGPALTLWRQLTEEINGGPQ
jgi:hypothetical protein